MSKSSKRVKRFHYKEVRAHGPKRPFNNKKRTKGRRSQVLLENAYGLFKRRVDLMTAALHEEIVQSQLDKLNNK